MDDALQELQHYDVFYFIFGFCIHFHNWDLHKVAFYIVHYV